MRKSIVRADRSFTPNIANSQVGYVVASVETIDSCHDITKNHRLHIFTFNYTVCLYCMVCHLRFSLGSFIILIEGSCMVARLLELSQCVAFRKHPYTCKVIHNNDTTTLIFNRAQSRCRPTQQPENV